MAKTIFITGASRGFGKIWAEAFLKRGDNVVATARDISTLDELVKQYGSKILPIQLDVNQRSADITAVKKARDHFGSIDVLINNAGYGLFGAIEETSEKEARADFFSANGFAPSEHPLISVVPCNGGCGLGKPFSGDFYVIMLKKLRLGTVHYGRTKYDHNNGSMLFVKPRQLVEFEDLVFAEAAPTSLRNSD